MRWILMFAALAGFATTGLADETIFLKAGKSVKVKIKTENGMGVTATPTSGAVKDLSLTPDEIHDIEYEILPIAVRIRYREGMTKDRDGHAEPAKAKLHFSDAIVAFDDTLKGMTPDPKASRGLQFRKAYLKAKLALDYKFGNPDAAAAELEAFRKANPDSWQITLAMSTLARLYQSKKEFDKAQTVFQDYAGLKIAPELKLEAEYQGAMSQMQSGKYKEATASLKALEAKLPKESKFAQKARVGQAECLAAGKQIKEANNVLRDIIKDTTDKGLKAMAYNAMGKNLYEVGQLKEARWPFLWVDTIYNQDKEEHAKSLYYLWQIFDKLGESDRAAECREALREKQFSNTEYQQRLGGN